MSISNPKLYTGNPVVRREDERLLRGLGRFIDDIEEPHGTLHLAMFRSPHAHARILSIDVSAASASPGVVAVYTGADLVGLTRPMLSPTPPGQPKLERLCMATDIVRHVGEVVAVVVAEDAYLAEDARELIEVNFDALPAALTIEQASAPDAPLVHDYLSSNVIFRQIGGTPDTDDVFASAPHVIGDVFCSGRVSAVPLEPRGFLTRYDPGLKMLDHISCAQFPHKMRWELAEALGMAEKNVRVVAPQIGGSFGMKGVTHSEDVIGAVIARKLKRPIKWMADRQEDLILLQGRDFQFGVEIACDDDGVLLAVRIRSRVDIGAYPLWISTSALEAGAVAHHMMGPYRVATYGFDVATVITHKPPTTSYRGVAAPINVLAMETLMERMAAKLGIDPIEIRRKNLISVSDLPYANAVGVVHDTASHAECLDRVLKLSGYREFKEHLSGRLGADGKYRGIGISTITDHTGQGTSIARARGQASRWPGYDRAIVKMEPDGKVTVYVSVASQGQGHETVFAQIVADHLGMSIDDVTVDQGDTNTMPFGTGAGASRAAVVCGGAVLKAGEKVAAKLRRIAAHLMDSLPEDIDLADGKAAVRGTNQFIDISELAATAYMIGLGTLPEGESVGIEVQEVFDPSTSVYSNASHAVCVAVDADTGRVEIEKYFVVHDCGKMLNPMIVTGQVVGAIIQGVGSVLTEFAPFSEEGQPLATTLLDYQIPTFLDSPLVTLDHVETPSTSNPGGVKGAGEGGIVGCVPAIALAITDALSPFHVSFNRVPILPDDVIRGMTAHQPA
ncbi:xanthine dehydrogenase family protein molybdopterin-binding subunit [Rhizobium lusitanum]|uniref:xanthine dehydrogenase family protein molybdopterin-binding subunit n=1 Tax=Rhizobium lusitanum TaxID=293958 RepID=UPI001573B5EF|nr:xanthine dehydrogenase family protein molybdopterin-binding subunit [Rhizobium lusitanum]NTJ11565.1 xanthine dehydrogenase family protein [Rhizobium lusitanum]